MIQIKIICNPDNTANLRDACCMALVDNKAFTNNDIVVADGEVDSDGNMNCFYICLGNSNSNDLEIEVNETNLLINGGK